MHVQDHEEKLLVVTNQNQNQYTPAIILKEWENTSAKRSSLLIKKKGKTVPVEKYLNSFTCIRYPLGVILVS